MRLLWLIGAWLALDLVLVGAWAALVTVADWRRRRREPFFPVLDEPLRGFQRELAEWDGRLPIWVESEARRGERS